MTSLVNCSDGKMSDLLPTLPGVVLMFASPVSPIYDARRPLDRIRDHIASRAELRIAA